MTLGIPMELLREHFTFHGRAGRLQWIFAGVAPWIGFCLFVLAVDPLVKMSPDHHDVKKKQLDSCTRVDCNAYSAGLVRCSEAAA